MRASAVSYHRTYGAPLYLQYCNKARVVSQSHARTVRHRPPTMTMQLGTRAFASACIIHVCIISEIYSTTA